MILVLGGTTEARSLAAALRGAGYEVLLSTATGYGADLAAPAGVTVRHGNLDPTGLAELVEGVDVVVDATHPFAEVISRMAASACSLRGRPYVRLVRPTAALPPFAVLAVDATHAARLAVESARAASGAILLTVGSKTVNEYITAARAAGVRIVARVLPTVDSLRLCAEAGLEPRDVVAMQGPTSAELDAALLRHHGATVLVTKDSGDTGGLGEKLRAVQLAGATAIVVERPAEPTAAWLNESAAGGMDRMAQRCDVAHARPEHTAVAPVVVHTCAEVLAYLGKVAAPVTAEAAATCAPESAPALRARLRRGLLHVYTGEGKGKTTAATGLALRALGAGLTVVFVQFVKGGRESSELAPLRAAGACVVRPAVRRCGLLRGTATDEDRAAAEEAWAAARAALSNPRCDLVVLDELHAALRHKLVDLQEVLVAVAARPPRQEVVTTGRGAPHGLLAVADLVTEMIAVRHPYPGVPARRGVEL